MDCFAVLVLLILAQNLKGIWPYEQIGDCWDGKPPICDGSYTDYRYYTDCTKYYHCGPGQIFVDSNAVLNSCTDQKIFDYAGDKECLPDIACENIPVCSTTSTTTTTTTTMTTTKLTTTTMTTTEPTTTTMTTTEPTTTTLTTTEPTTTIPTTTEPTTTSTITTTNQLTTTTLTTTEPTTTIPTTNEPTTTITTTTETIASSKPTTATTTIIEPTTTTTTTTTTTKPTTTTTTASTSTTATINLDSAVDPCQSSPCQNEGTCEQNAKTNDYTCTCKPGWVDKNCQTATTMLAVGITMEEQWNEDYTDPNSEMFQKLSTKLCTVMRQALEGGMESENCKVTSFKEGSVVADVVLEMKSDPTDKMALAQLKQDLRESLEKVLGNATMTKLVANLTFSIDNGKFTIGDYNECLNPKDNDCYDKLSCLNLDGSFTCRCPSSVRYRDESPKGRDGRICTEKCQTDTCYNDGLCAEVKGTTVNCTCSSGYTGAYCREVVLSTTMKIVIVCGSVAAFLLIVSIITLCWLCFRESRHRDGSKTSLTEDSTSQIDDDRTNLDRYFHKYPHEPRYLWNPSKQMNHISNAMEHIPMKEASAMKHIPRPSVEGSVVVSENFSLEDDFSNWYKKSSNSRSSADNQNPTSNENGVQKLRTFQINDRRTTHDESKRQENQDSRHHNLMNHNKQAHSQNQQNYNRNRQNYKHNRQNHNQQNYNHNQQNGRIWNSPSNRDFQPNQPMANHAPQTTKNPYPYIQENRFTHLQQQDHRTGFSPTPTKQVKDSPTSLPPHHWEQDKQTGERRRKLGPKPPPKPSSPHSKSMGGTPPHDNLNQNVWNEKIPMDRHHQHGKTPARNGTQFNTPLPKQHPRFNDRFPNAHSRADNNIKDLYSKPNQDRKSYGLPHIQRNISHDHIGSPYNPYQQQRNSPSQGQRRFDQYWNDEEEWI